MITIKKGLDLPIHGAPEQKIYDAPKISKVALTGFDYVGMKPTMHVQVGDKVKKGQVVFECKKVPGVKYTAPGAGEVIEINRGEKRVFQSIVIKLDSSEESVKFETCDPTSADDKELTEIINNAGLWTTFRTRPYSKSPELDSRPDAIFVTAMDTNPLSANYDLIVSESFAAFEKGLDALNRLTGKVFVCVRSGSSIQTTKATVEEFGGVHPAGLAGTHMHFLNPVSDKKVNWSIDAQDVIAIGDLLENGELNVERVVAFSGPQVKSPRLLKTRQGACLCELTNDQLLDGENRVISGSPLYGRTSDKKVLCYLTRFAKQVTVLKEGRTREFLGWHSPGVDKFSVKNIYLSALTPSKKFGFTTTTNGSFRSMVPIGMYEKVMPLDILPTHLLRAICSDDTEYAQKLGALELDEEDLALCTFVDPGKVDYGPILRRNLEIIEKEG